MHWIKARTNLAAHPAILRAAAVLRVDVDLVVGKVIRLWSYASEHGDFGATGDCLLAGLDYEIVDAMLGAPGLCAALPPNWMRLERDGVVLPAAARWTGSVKERSAARERKARSRQGAAPAANVTPRSQGSHCDMPVTLFSSLSEKQSEKSHGDEGGSGGKSKRGARRCPASWELTPALRAFAESVGLAAAGVDAEHQKFRDHTFSRTITDWDATWRNWARKAVELQPRRVAASPAGHDYGAEYLRRRGFDDDADRSRQAGAGAPGQLGHADVEPRAIRPVR